MQVSERADPVLIGGRFRVVRRLGEGGFAQVFEVSDQQTGARKALKYLDKLRDSDRSRFKREAFASNTVAQHSGHVLKVHDAEFDGATGVPFITMDLLEGQTLADVVSPQGAPPRPMSLAQARAVLSEVAHALSAAHRCDLVHCDLKPENVFLANTRDADRVAPKVYVLDFGIARLADHHATHHTTAMGTFRWMAPERMSGHATPASDVFSFTLLAAYLLVGRHVAPFDVPRTGLVAWAKSHGVSLPPALDPWFAAGTHTDPHARTQTIAASFRDFEAALAQPQATVAWAHPDAFAPTQAIPSTPRISHAIAPAPAPSVRHSPVRIVLLTSLGVFALAALGYGGLRLVTAEPRVDAGTPAPAPLVARSQSAAPLERSPQLDATLARWAVTSWKSTVTAQNLASVYTDAPIVRPVDRAVRSLAELASGMRLMVAQSEAITVDVSHYRAERDLGEGRPASSLQACGAGPLVLVRVQASTSAYNCGGGVIRPASGEYLLRLRAERDGELRVCYEAWSAVTDRAVCRPAP